MKLFEFKPKLVSCLKNYSKETFMADLMAGIIVGIVALPVSLREFRPKKVLSPLSLRDSSFPCWEAAKSRSAVLREHLSSLSMASYNNTARPD